MLDSPFGMVLLPIKTQLLLGIAHIGFESSAQFLIADDSFHRRIGERDLLIDPFRE